MVTSRLGRRRSRMRMHADVNSSSKKNDASITAHQKSAGNLPLFASRIHAWYTCVQIFRAQHAVPKNATQLIFFMRLCQSTTGACRRSGMLLVDRMVDSFRLLWVREHSALEAAARSSNTQQKHGKEQATPHQSAMYTTQMQTATVHMVMECTARILSYGTTKKLSMRHTWTTMNATKKPWNMSVCRRLVSPWVDEYAWREGNTASITAAMRRGAAGATSTRGTKRTDDQKYTMST